MRRERSNGPGLAVAAAVLGGVVAVAAATGLAALARPVDRAARLAELDRKLDRIEALQKSASGAPAFPRGAVCRDGGMGGAGVVEQTVRAGLGQARLVRIAFDPAAPIDGAGLSVVGFRFETLGSYEDAMTLLGGLAAARPTLFADTMDLTSKTSAVSLQVSGRFYCSTSARL